MNAIRGWLYGKPEGGSSQMLASDTAPSNNSTPAGSLPPAPQTPQQQQPQQQPRLPVNIPMPPQQPVMIPGGLPVERQVQQPPQARPIEQQQQATQTQELHQAADRVNETKSLYDSCEARRMTAVINGKDAQDYSCEREFAAFKKAFDIQLALESKMPPVGSQGH